MIICIWCAMLQLVTTFAIYNGRGNLFNNQNGQRLQWNLQSSRSATEFTLIPQIQNDDTTTPSDQRRHRSVSYTGTEISFHGPSSHTIQIRWAEKPRRVLFLSKPDANIYGEVKEAIKYLKANKIQIVVEEKMLSVLQCKDVTVNSEDQVECIVYDDEDDEIDDKTITIFDPEDKSIDFVILFGGDGLLLHCSTLFQHRSIPPVIFFDFGSFGFLSSFCYADFKSLIDKILNDRTALLTLRMRLECSVVRNGTVQGVYNVLNEAVVDRGPSPFLSVVDLTCDSQYLTTLQGDGIIIATPTGSTAYSLAAGGSIVYPSVPAILLTPICAHTLSFRPMILPDSAVLTCAIPLECRSSGWVSFDGKFRQELHRGDKLRIKMSRYPVPTINRLNYTGDWFDSLRAGFLFNLRPRQKSN